MVAGYIEFSNSDTYLCKSGPHSFIKTQLAEMQENFIMPEYQR